MARYFVYEGFLPDLEKKVATIRRKCEKYGCDFTFEVVGEEFRDVEDPSQIDPETRKPVVHKLKFIEVEAEGTAQINGWKFVGAVEHTSKGNIFSKALTDVEIPERYRTSECVCEHCNSKRHRSGTFIVINTESGEFKQVGHNCLRDYTHGMSASGASFFASLKHLFEEEEQREISFSSGRYVNYYNTEEFLRYTDETIRHFGYTKSTSDSVCTRQRAFEFYAVAHHETRRWERSEVARIERIMDDVGFNADSDEAKQMTADALEWIQNQEAKNDYMHNLKTVTSLNYVSYDKFGILVSLFPTFNRDLEIQAERREEAEKGAISKFVGNVGDRIDVNVESVKCITSWESCYNGYSSTTTYIWKIVSKDGNIYTWKTSTRLSEDYPPAVIKGTVKEHKTFRDIKQTELTRCKIQKSEG